MTLNSLQTEWIRDWKTSPHWDAFTAAQQWYDPQIEYVRKRLASGCETVTAI